MAAGGENRWPSLGRNRWPLTDRAVTVQPRVARFDDPPSRAPAGSQRLVGDLLAPRADVPSETVPGHESPDFGVVIGLVEAQALGLFWGRCGTIDRDRLERALQQLVIVAVRAVVIEPDRDPCGVRDDRALRPLLALSVGFGPVFGPPKGALVIAPSPDMNDQSIPTCSSYSSSP